MPKPGQHSLEPFLPDRSLGALRDTILILLPGPKVLLVALHREALDGTVAETLLRHGTGALHIDACRTGYGGKSLEQVRKEAGSPTHHGPTRHVEYGGGWNPDRGAIEFHPAGRWPPNVILVHGPACQHKGSATVPRHLRDAAAKATPSLFGDMGGSRAVGVTTEHVNLWDCQPDCPVRLLDQQAGLRRAGGHVNTQSQGFASNSYMGGGSGSSPFQSYGDSGSASRFFPTFQSLDEAKMWLQRLVGQS